MGFRFSSQQIPREGQPLTDLDTEQYKVEKHFRQRARDERHRIPFIQSPAVKVLLVL